MQTLNLIKKYKTYPEYKDSGVEWLGKIPKEWTVASSRRLFTTEKEQVGSSFADYKILSLTLRGVIPRVLDGSGKNPAEYDTYQVFKKDDLVFCLFDYDVTPRTIGYVEENGMLTGAYTRLIPREETFSKYFYYYFLSLDYTKELLHLCTGLRNSISKPLFWSMKSPLPDIQIQEKIANYLDEKTSSIDQIIEKKEKQIELLKEEIVSIAMNEQKSGKGETVRLRNLFKLAEKPINIEDYSEYTALGLYNRGRGLFHKDPQLGKDIKESDFYKVLPRDLIISGQFAWEGAVALASKDESECVVSHRYYLLRDGLVKTEYLLALLITKFGDHLLNESSRGSAGRNKPLNIKILLSEKIRIPSKDVEEGVESLLIKMNSIRNNIKISIKLLEEFKSSLISSAVTGKIRI